MRLRRKKSIHPKFAEGVEKKGASKDQKYKNYSMVSKCHITSAWGYYGFGTCL